MPRIAPLPGDRWDPDLQPILQGGIKDPSGQPLNIFGTMANHPKLFRRWLVFANHVLGKSTLSLRHRELLILRTGYRCRSEYEWGQHVAIALRCDITREEVERVAAGPDAAGWDLFEAALLRAADELHDQSKVSDATWATLATRYGTEQLMDAVFTVGNYHVVAMALNTFGVEREPGVEGLPD